MSQKPNFSIVIPALNESRYLPSLLTDLCKQTYQDFEVIVVDGKSTDNTTELVNNFSGKLPKLTILTSDRRHVCTQRNLGAKHALGETLIFSDADNRLPPFFLQGIKYRLESLGADVLSPYIEPDIKTPQNNTIAKAFNLFLEAQVATKAKVLLESLVVIRKKSFQKIGGFNDQIDYAEGRDMIKKIYQHHQKIKIIKDPSYSFSFRRFRKFGILGTISRIANISLSTLIEGYSNEKARQMYPMLGGALFEKENNRSKELKNKIQTFLKKLQDI